MAKKFNFTKKTIDALPLPEKNKFIQYYDGKIPGLALYVGSEGTKTFYFYRKYKGQPLRIKIGRYPDMSIESARGKASALNADIANGINPLDEIRKAKKELAFGSLFDEYLTRHARPYKKTWDQDQDNYNWYLKHWKNRPISRIWKKDIQSLHAKLGKENGHYTANRVLFLLSTVFNKGVEWGFCDNANPAQGVKKFPEKTRERFLQADELPRFFEALAKEPNDTIRDYFLISLLTGARRSNVLSMKWNEVNLDNATWTIPETKAGRRHLVPLTPEAIEILRNRQGKDGSPFVFPSTGKSGHLGQQHKAWKRILKRAGIDDLRIQDLRRTLGSWQAATGASLVVIGKTLDHSNVSTTAIYARLNIDPVRESMEKATKAMLSVGELRPDADVLPLKK